MSLSFLSPLFALGLAAIAVPIFVHLVHKERKETTQFPSLMFLRRVPYRHSSRKKLRDVLLFALRALVVIAAIAAFSRPVIERAQRSAATTAGGREVVVLVDRSFSMRYADRWGRAQTAVRQAIDGIGPRDQMTIVPFDLTARAVNETSGDHAVLRTAFDSLRPVDGGTRYAPAMALARRILAGSKLPEREVVVISDFQRSAFDLTEESRLPPGVRLTSVEVASGDVVDRAVRSVELRRTTSGTKEQLSVHARVGNLGPAARGVELVLSIGGRAMETKRVDLPADGGAAVDFASIPVPVAPQSAEVRLRTDSLAGDDVFSFVFARTPVVNVLLVNAADMPADRDIFVRRALEIGDRPPFEVHVRSANGVTPADLATNQVILLNDAWPSDAIAGRLVDRVREGAGLIVATGDRMGVRARGVSETLLPAPIVAPVDREGERGGVLGYLDASHPALSLFGASRSGDLSAARFFRYRPVNASTGVMARFDDGTGALAELRVGKGRVLQFGSSLDGYWNDLPRQPVFLPFLHQLSRYAADFRDRRDAYVVGEAVDDGSRAATDTTPNAASRVARVAESPSGRRIRFGGAGEPVALVPDEAGVFAIRRAGSPGERPRLVAVNIDPRELEFARFDPTRLAEAVRSTSSSATASDSAATATPRDREREQSLWWYILVIVTAALVAEALLARRISLRRPSVT
ncbi:MAG: BatA and WFA domain-containing protein [Gemmatimonadaceae bacterium]